MTFQCKYRAHKYSGQRSVDASAGVAEEVNWVDAVRRSAMHSFIAQPFNASNAPHTVIAVFIRYGYTLLLLTLLLPLLLLVLRQHIM